MVRFELSVAQESFEGNISNAMNRRLENTKLCKHAALVGKMLELARLCNDPNAITPWEGKTHEQMQDMFNCHSPEDVLALSRNEAWHNTIMSKHCGFGRSDAFREFCDGGE